MRKFMMAFVFCGLCVFGVNLEEASACEAIRKLPELFGKVWAITLSDELKKNKELLVLGDAQNVEVIAVTPTESKKKYTEAIVKIEWAGTVIYFYQKVDSTCEKVLSDEWYTDFKKVKALVKKNKLEVLGGK